jgi:hypothetical protein
MDNAKRIEAREKRVSDLERAFFAQTDRPDGNIIGVDLTLPEDGIDGLHFNETKVHAVFEKKDGAYYSRNILFLSAGDTAEGTGRDLLSEYLNKHEH